MAAVANVIAAPAGYFIMQRWLQGYAFRTSIEIHVFILAGAIGLLTALLSVGWQTFRASAANPADSLRYE